MKKQTIVKAIFASSILSASCIALAATNTGTVTISANIKAIINLTMPTNSTINFGDIDPSGQNALTNKLTGICVYTNNGTGNYTVTASSSKGGQGKFALSDGASTPHTIPYTVAWYNTGDASGTGTSLTAGTKSTSITGADQKSINCSTSGNNASLAVTLQSGDLQAVPASAYSDTLNIVVAAS